MFLASEIVIRFLIPCPVLMLLIIADQSSILITQGHHIYVLRLFLIIKSMDPVNEVKVAYNILKALGLREYGPTLISCPTCGRTRINLEKLALEVERRLNEIAEPITIAVMGCVVNGPGEAREADIGIAGGIGEGLLFRKGEIIKKVSEDKIVDELFDEIKKILVERKMK